MSTSKEAPPIGIRLTPFVLIGVLALRIAGSREEVALTLNFLGPYVLGLLALLGLLVWLHVKDHFTRRSIAAIALVAVCLLCAVLIPQPVNQVLVILVTGGFIGWQLRVEDRGPRWA